MKNFHLEINPAEIEDEYLRHLNLCFEDWGDRKQFDWYFRRHTIFPDADLLILRQNGKSVAGSAISYRQVRLPNDEEIKVGIMTGSWTLPEFRGQGIFAYLIEISKKQMVKKGASFLLGFAREQITSRRQLEKAGSVMFPSWYLSSTEAAEIPSVNAHLRQVEANEKNLTKLFEQLNERGKGFARFIYPSLEDVRAQFVKRSNSTEILLDEYGNFGIIEKKRDTYILQLHLAPFENEEIFTASLASFFRYALARNKKFFLFTMQPKVMRATINIGLKAENGFLTFLNAGEETHGQETIRDLPINQFCWYVHSGDRA